MQTLSLLSYVFFFLSFIAGPIALFCIFRYRAQVRKGNTSVSPKVPIFSVIGFMLCLVISMLFTTQTQSIGLDEALTYLNGSNEPYKVSVNGASPASEQDVIKVLKQTRPYTAHHSHPGTPIKVQIEGKSGNIELKVCRDSGKPHEYWVFYMKPGVSILEKNEIGRVTTTLFDSYNP